MKISVLLVCLLSVSAWAQTPSPRRESRPAIPPADQQEAESLTTDIARMRTLLQQMEMNLALVATTQSPLKHQFELEIDMWRIVLSQAERRLQRLRGSSAGGVVSPGTVPLRQDSKQEKP